MSSVLCLGEALIDVVHRGDQVSDHVGGSVLNVALGCARLDHPTHLATWVGRDARARLITDALAAGGVQLVPGSDEAERTPVALATIDELGKASYTFDLEWRLPEIPDALEVGHVHTGSFAATLEPGAEQVADAVAALREHSSVSYDPNIRPALMDSPDAVRPRIEALVAMADVVKASDEDLLWLHPDESLDDVMARLLASGPKLVVVTRGADGAVARLASEPDPLPVQPLTVTVGDTVGAGDSFMAGMISGLLDAGLLGSREAVDRLGRAGWDAVAPALQRAATTSGITVSHVGAYGPTRDEL